MEAARTTRAAQDLTGRLTLFGSAAATARVLAARGAGWRMKTPDGLGDRGAASSA